MNYYTFWSGTSSPNSFRTGESNTHKRGRMNQLEMDLRYFLRTLNTDQILKMPRTRAIDLELLFRKGVRDEDRQAALADLAKQDKTSELRVLLDALRRVDETVDGTEGGGDLLGRPAHGGLVGDIALDGGDPGVVAFQFLQRLNGPVDGGDVPALAGPAEGSRPAHAAGRTGDDGDARCVHVFSLVVGFQRGRPRIRSPMTLCSTPDVPPMMV